MAAPIEHWDAKWKVSKFDDPLCKYPWAVDGPDGQLSDVFEAWAEAIEHAELSAYIEREGGQHGND